MTSLLNEIPTNIDGWGVLYTVVTLLLGGGLVKILNWVKESKKETRNQLREDGIAFRQNLLDRIEELEKREKENSANIIELTKENVELRTKVEALERENDELERKVKELRRENEELRS